MPEPEPPHDVTQPAPALPGADSVPAHSDPTGGAPRPGPAPGVPARVGRYDIRAVLGNGAFGRVYHAFDSELHRDVAIKVPLQAGLSAEFRERFLREARAAATIRHPNVCPIYDVGSDGDLPFIVMHYVTGGTLAGMIERRKEPFPPRQAAIVIRKLANGIAAAHARGVIHRDLKPQNVLVEEEAGNREVLITDFGLARLGSEAQITAEGVTVGTPLYMAPEQAHGKQAVVGPLSDVYSLGVMLYLLLSGEPPFTGSVLEVLAQKQFSTPKPPAEVRPGVDARVSELCMRAMAREPGERFPSAKAMAEALEAYLRGAAPDRSGERAVLNVPPVPQPVQPEPISLDDEPVRPMVVLMRWAARAVVGRRRGLGGVADEVADALRRYGEQDVRGLRTELEAAAAATPEEAKTAAAEVARDATSSKPDEAAALVMYLSLLPVTIRRGLRRADDPAGLTVPSDFRPEAARLLPLLPARLPRFREGQPVPGRADWVLARWLGGDGFGEAWLAAHRKPANRPAVVKFGTDLTAEQRVVLTREARPALRNTPNHAGLVRPFDADLAGNPPWVMSEFVAGGDLTDLILTWQQLPPAGRVRAAGERLRELTEAVAALHGAGLVHRGLRPANVLRDPTDFRLRVTDVGTGGVGPRPDGQLYAGPQQQRGDPPGPRDDVYALGVIAFQMLTGSLTSGVPADYDRILKKLGVPAGLAQLIGACAATEPEHRPPDARALADRLAPFAAPADPAGASASGAIRFAPDDEGRTEVLGCPGCRARMQVKVGRTAPVRCPRCARSFAVADGRAAAAVAPIPPAGKPAKKKEPPRRRSRVFRVGCLTLVLGSLAILGFVFHDDVARWAEDVQAKPVEFELVKEFEPGADEARVYEFLPTDPPQLLTNADNKTVVAAVWDATAGKRLWTLKNCVPDAKAHLDPATLRFRFNPTPSWRLAVFHRDVLAEDRGSIWVYDGPKLDPKGEAPKAAPELTPFAMGQPERAWDVSRDHKWSVRPPGGAKLRLWILPSGLGTKSFDLEAPGTTFRAAAFSPDSRWLVTLDDESRLGLWNLETWVFKEPTRTVRLGSRPDYAGADTADLVFDPSFTRVTVRTEHRTGVWALTDGRVIEPSRPTSAGAVLRDGYRLRAETGGKGTFSFFHDEHTLRAAKLTVPGGGDVSSWCLSDDRTLLAASSRRSVTVWRLKYPPK